MVMLRHARCRFRSAWAVRSGDPRADQHRTPLPPAVVTSCVIRVGGPRVASHGDDDGGALDARPDDVTIAQQAGLYGCWSSRASSSGPPDLGRAEQVTTLARRPPRIEGLGAVPASDPAAGRGAARQARMTAPHQSASRSTACRIRRIVDSAGTPIPSRSRAPTGRSWARRSRCRSGRRRAPRTRSLPKPRPAGAGASGPSADPVLRPRLSSSMSRLVHPSHAAVSSVPSRKVAAKRGANGTVKILALIAGMVCGADDKVSCSRPTATTRCSPTAANRCSPRRPPTATTPSLNGSSPS